MRNWILRAKRRYIVLVFLSLTGGSLWAQTDSLTLEMCMRLAVQRNLQIRQLHEDQHLARANHRQAVGAFLPEANAGGTIGKRFGRSVDPQTNMYTSSSFVESNVGIQVTMPLFEGFARLNRLQFEKLNRQISSLSVQAGENAVAFQAMDAFYTLALEKELLDLTRQQRQLTEKYDHQMAVFLQMGLKSPSDMQQVKARLKADLYQETVRENGCRMALLVLKQLLNLKESDSLVIVYDRHALVPQKKTTLQADSLYEVSLGMLPESRSLELQLQAAHKSVAVARGAFAPVIEAEYNLNSGYYNTERNEHGHIISYLSQLDNNVNHYIGLKLSVPLFGRLKRITALRNEQTRLRKTQTTTRQHRQTLRADIENACLSLEAAYDAFVQAAEQVKAEELSLKTAQRKWEEGLVSVFELIEIRNRYISARAEVIRAGIQYKMQDMTVEFYKCGSFLL